MGNQERAVQESQRQSGSQLSRDRKVRDGMGRDIGHEGVGAINEAEKGMDGGGRAGDAGTPGQSVATEGKRKRVKTLVFSRVVGYYQPVTNWNIGKQQEYKDRAIYDVAEARKAAVSHD